MAWPRGSGSVTTEGPEKFSKNCFLQFNCVISFWWILSLNKHQHILLHFRLVVPHVSSCDEKRFQVTSVSAAGCNAHVAGWHQVLPSPWPITSHLKTLPLQRWDRCVSPERNVWQRHDVVRKILLMPKPHFSLVAGLEEGQLEVTLQILTKDENKTSWSCKLTKNLWFVCFWTEVSILL